MRTPVPVPVKLNGALARALDDHYRRQGMGRRLREARFTRPFFWEPEPRGEPQPTSLQESDRGLRFTERERQAMGALQTFVDAYGGTAPSAAHSPIARFTETYRRHAGGRTMEDEQGLPDQGDVDDLVADVKRGVGDDTAPRMRVRCPGCKTRFELELPDDVAVAPSNDDSEEAADTAVTVACPECEREMQVVAPRGYRFRDSEAAAGEIACHDEAMKASEALVQHFIRRYLGRPGANDGRTALEQFKESYGRAGRDGRLGAMPPD